MKSIKLIMTLLVRDEEDILRANIDFHLSQGVDLVIATDNKSCDSTKEILKSYEAKGQLVYIYEGDDDMSQHKWVTRMARMAASRYGADWVINNDADEFWWPRERSLKETFASLPPGTKVVQAQRTNFVHVSTQDDTHAKFYETMVFRSPVSLNPIGQPLPPKQAHIGSRTVTVDTGNHSVGGIGPQNIHHGPIDVLHFPIRSHSQALRKIVATGAAFARNTELPKGIGEAIRTIYSEYLETGNIDRYYQSILYGRARLVSELRSGTIVEDTRLKAFLTLQPQTTNAGRTGTTLGRPLGPPGC